jgi:hypothetical protein
VLSIPAYHDDAVQRNLKHALLNISSDIPTIISALTSLLMVLIKRRTSIIGGLCSLHGRTSSSTSGITLEHWVGGLGYGHERATCQNQGLVGGEHLSGLPKNWV